eukprot:Platyproteum_vivax@DN6530_c0_g1_i2.p1
MGNSRVMLLPLTESVSVASYRPIGKVAVSTKRLKITWSAYPGTPQIQHLFLKEVAVLFKKFILKELATTLDVHKEYQHNINDENKHKQQEITTRPPKIGTRPDYTIQYLKVPKYLGNEEDELVKRRVAQHVHFPALPLGTVNRPSELGLSYQKLKKLQFNAPQNKLPPTTGQHSKSHASPEFVAAQNELPPITGQYPKYKVFNGELGLSNETIKKLQKSVDKSNLSRIPPTRGSTPQKKIPQRTPHRHQGKSRGRRLLSPVEEKSFLGNKL